MGTNPIILFYNRESPFQYVQWRHQLHHRLVMSEIAALIFYKLSIEGFQVTNEINEVISLVGDDGSRP
jgi:hypothetical protein